MYHLPLFANPRNGQYSALFVVCLNEFEGLFEGLRWDKMVLGCRVKQMLCSRSQCPVSTLWSWRGEQVICNRSILSIQCTTLFSAYTSSSISDIIPLQNPSTHKLIIGRILNGSVTRPSYREAPILSLSGVPPNHQVQASEQVMMGATLTGLSLVADIHVLYAALAGHTLPQFMLTRQ